MLPLRPAAILMLTTRAPEPKPATTARDEVAFAADKPGRGGRSKTRARLYSRHVSAPVRSVPRRRIPVVPWPLISSITPNPAGVTTASVSG